MSSNVLPAAASALAILVAGSTAFLLPMGPLSAHMLLHIALMNLAAPLAAIVLVRACPAGFDRAALLWTAAIVQIVLLWAWHAPPAHRAATGSILISFVMHASLFVSALAFWTLLTRMSARNRWQVILSLLVTGKLACLLGALLIFSPRALYELSHGHHYATHSTLDDQQLAGLYMVVACPLSFVLAGIIVAAQVMRDLGRHPAALAR